MRPDPRRARGAALLPLLLALGCAHPKFKAEIDDFDRTMAAGTSALGAYYTGLNDQELDLYFELLKIDPTLEVGDRFVFVGPRLDAAGVPVIGPDGKPVPERIAYDSPLKNPPFSARAVQNKIDALHYLSAYGKALAELAGNDSNTRFRTSVGSLAERLAALRRDIENDKAAEDPTGDRYLKPLGTIVGIVGDRIVDERRWSALRKAVLEADAPVDTVLRSVAEDLRTVNVVFVTGADERYTTAIVYYNLQRTKLANADRIATLDRIRAYRTAVDVARQNGPSELAEDLREANRKLVEVAKNDRRPRDLAALAGQLEVVKDDVRELVDAAKTIAGER